MKNFILYSLLMFRTITSHAGLGNDTTVSKQYNTVATIVSCSNCTVVDGSASGSLGSDDGLTIIANSFGPVTIRVKYTFDWDQGTNNNWIHGVSLTAGNMWSSSPFSTPAGWIYMPNGLPGKAGITNNNVGYFYDGTGATSIPQTLTVQFVGPGGCTSTYRNSTLATNPLGQIINDDESKFTEISGNCKGNKLSDMTTTLLNPRLGYAGTANDGNPANNWGINCTSACPDFYFDLTYFPSTSNPTDITSPISLITIPDSKSGSWCLDDNFDFTNTFNVTIKGAYGSVQPIDGTLSVFSTNQSETFQQSIPIPIELKQNPEEFFIINDKPVTKQEYLEYLLKKEDRKKSSSPE